MNNANWDDIPTFVDFSQRSPTPQQPQAIAEQPSGEGASWDDLPSYADFSNPAAPKIEPLHELDKTRAMSRLEYLSLPFEQRAEISKQIGQSGKEEVGAALFEGLIPGGEHIVEKGRREGYLPHELPGAVKYPLGALKYGSMAAPIGVIAKGVGKIGKAFEPALKQAGKYAQGAAALTEAAATGAGYKTAETMIGEQRKPTAGEVAGEAGLFAGGHLVGWGVSKAYTALKGKITGPKDITVEQIMDEMLKGELPSAGFYDEVNEALSAIKAAEPRGSRPFQTIVTSVNPRPPSLRGRVTRGQARDFGMEIEVPGRHPSTEQGVLEAFNVRPISTTEAGREVTHLMRKMDQSVYENVGKLYARSRELNRGVEAIRPELVGQLQTRIESINIPSPDPVQQGLIREAENIIEGLVIRGENGGVVGYRRVNNQQLIDQIQAIRTRIDHEFAHGDKNNIFRLLTQDIEEDLIRTSNLPGEKAARDALITARDGYRNWAENFSNKYVDKFRDLSNRDFSKNFEGLTDIDNFNAVRNLLDQVPEGQIIREGLQRDITEKYLGKFLANPRSANPREIQKALRELEAVLEPRQYQQVRATFERELRRNNIRVTGRTTTQAQKDEALLKKASDYMKMNEEDLIRKFNTRSGIKEVRDKMAKTPELYNKLVKQKVREIVYAGKVNAKPTGKELYDILNKSKNRELLVELIGEDTFNEAFKAAEKAGDNEMTKQAWINAFKAIGTKSAKIAKLGAIGLIL